MPLRLLLFAALLGLTGCERLISDSATRLACQLRDGTVCLTGLR